MCWTDGYPGHSLPVRDGTAEVKPMNDAANAVSQDANDDPLRREAGRPKVSVQDVLRRDPIPPAATLLEPSAYVPEGNSIPISRYIDPAFQELETTRMWSRVWQYACWSQDIPEPGDVSVYRNAGQSVLIVRQRDGSVKAFRNSCLHRGREICGENRSARVLRCPYHGFTWTLDGTLQTIPAAWDFDIERSEFALPEVRVDQWNGFVFINLDAEAAPLSVYLGKMVDQWRGWDFASTRFRAVTVRKPVNCNWKAVSDAFVETLHVFATHPELALFAPATSAQYDCYPDEPHFTRFHAVVGRPADELDRTASEQDVLDGFTSSYLTEAFGTEAGRLRPGETAREGLARLSRATYRDRLGLDVSAMPEAELLDAVQYTVFPNMHVWPSLANPLVYRFFPGPTPDICIWETSLFYPFQGERPPSGPTYDLTLDQSMADVPELGLFGPLLQQDAENLRYMQDGLKSSATGVMRLSRYHESGIRHLHNTLGSYVGK